MGQQMTVTGLWVPRELLCPEGAALLGMCPQSHRMAGKSSEESAPHAAGLVEISRAFVGPVTREKPKWLNQGSEGKIPREEISIDRFRHLLDADSSWGTTFPTSMPHGAALDACLLLGAQPGSAGGFLGRGETPCTGAA